MKGYIGYWEERLTFSPAPEDDDIFVFLPLSVRIEGRKVTLVVDDQNGTDGFEVEADRNGGLIKQYSWKGIYEPWARWRRHEVELTITNEGYTFEVEADHLLPWPKFIDQGGDFNPTEVAVREFRKRAQSAYQYGGDKELKKVLRTIPPKCKKLIRTQVWADIITEIRKETHLCLNHNGTSCSTSRPSEPVPMQL